MEVFSLLMGKGLSSCTLFQAMFLQTCEVQGRLLQSNLESSIFFKAGVLKVMFKDASWTTTSAAEVF
jgi:hypothetical protein